MGKLLSQNLSPEEFAVLDTIIKNIESIKEEIVAKENNQKSLSTDVQELSDMAQQKLAEEKKIRDENNTIFKNAITLSNKWKKERDEFNKSTNEDIDLLKKARKAYNAKTQKFEGLTEREEA